MDDTGNIYISGVFYDTLFAGPQMLPPAPNRHYSSSSNLPPNRDVFFAKYTAAGELKWTRSLNGPEIYFHVGSSARLFNRAAFAVDAAGNLYAHGIFSAESRLAIADTGAVTLAQDTPAWVSLNSEGEMRWIRLSGKDVSWYWERPFLYVDNVQNKVATLYHSNDDYDPWDRIGMTWISFDGEVISTHELLRARDVKLSDIALDRRSHVYVAGRFWGHALYFGDGSGFISNSARNNTYDGFIAEFSSVGELVRVVHMPEYWYRNGMVIAVNSLDELIAAGEFSNTMYLGTDTLYAEGLRDAFIANYGSSVLVGRVTEQVDAAYPKAVKRKRAVKPIWKR